MPRLPGLPRSLYYGQIVNRASPLNRGLVSWWLNLPQRGKGNTFFDIAGRNHGTLTNGPTFQGPLGRPGGFGSIKGDGVDSGTYIASFLPNVSTSTFSHGGWVRPVTTSSGMYIANGGNGGVFNVFAIILGFQSGFFNVFNGAYPTGDPADTQIAATANEWQHIWYVTTGSRVYGYKNGVRVIDVAASLGSVIFDSYIIGAARTSDYANSYDGYWDDWRIVPADYSGNIAASYDDSSRGYPQTLNRVSPYTVFDVGGVFDGCLELQDGTGHLLLQNGTGCLAGQAAEQAVAGARLLSGGNMSSGVGIMTGGAL